jgi:rare lipoprotein A
MTRLAAMAAGAAFMVLGVTTPSLSPSADAAERARNPQQHQRAAHARPERGTASYYAPRLNGRRMANGRRFDARSNSAAHRTLPLGTTARVTNLDNGRSAEVKVEDRGPYARNRVIDLSPRTAHELGMKEQGTAPVVVTPVEVPDHDERIAQR